MPRYTLHGYFRSSCSFRVRIALALKGIPYDHVPVHLIRDGGEQHTPAYRRLNPVGEVPALEIQSGDTAPAVLAQSVAILEYLEEVHPEPPLLPDAPIARAQVRQLVEVVNSSIQPVQNLKVMGLLSEDFGTDRAANFAWAGRWIDRHFEGLEILVQRLAGRHAFGDQVTLADVAIVPQVFNAHRFGVDMGRFPVLTRVDEAAMALDAFRLAAPDAQPDAPGDP